MRARNRAAASPLTPTSGSQGRAIMLAVGVTRYHSAKGREKGLMRDRRDNESRVLDAIRARGTRNFTGAEIADEVGLCRQTIYKIIAALKSQGHRIEGTCRLGFMARLSEENYKPSPHRELYALSDVLNSPFGEPVHMPTSEPRNIRL